MTSTFSLTAHTADKTRLAFYCDCKKCGNKLTPYVSVGSWLDIAFVLVQNDLLTPAEFKNLNHLAVSQWETIAPMLEN
jgi:hypothetical protein